MKHFFRALIFILGLSTILQAQDPLAILEQLPPPEVEYPKAPAKSYPPAELDQTDEDDMSAEVAPVNAPPLPPPKIDTKKLIEQNTPRVVKSLSGLIKSISQPTASKTTEIASSPKAVAVKAAESKDGAKPLNEAEVKKPKIIKPLPIQTQAYQALKTLQKNPLIDEWDSALKKDYSLFLEAIELSQKMSAEKEGSEDPVEGEEGSETEEGKEKGKSFDSVFAKAAGLKKSEKWKDIANLMKDNPEAAETPEGLELSIEANLSLEKPNIMAAKRSADALLKKDKENGWANYAMALHFLSAKKPNTEKGSTHLDLALKAKNPPAGASKLYWSMMLKKIVPVFLILLAGIIGGINQIIKKKKAARALLEGDGQAQPEPVSSEVPVSGLAAKFKPMLEKLAPLLQKFQKKKTTGAEIETPPPSSEQVVTEVPEANPTEPEEPTEQQNSPEPAADHPEAGETATQPAAEENQIQP
ncbi:MAG: hypothetical protein ACOYXC_08220 [Candidatus Rifleibacteriota bacterium]